VDEPLVSGELRIDPQQDAPDKPIDLFWRGRSIERYPVRTVVPYVSAVLSRAKSQGVPVRLHFETIEHMNSSTITAVIQIIQEARSHETRLEIVFDRDKSWQKLSFEALAVFLKGDGLLELVGSGGA
jgi:hypothetical protein